MTQLPCTIMATYQSYQARIWEWLAIFFPPKDSYVFFWKFPASDFVSDECADQLQPYYERFKETTIL